MAVPENRAVTAPKGVIVTGGTGALGSAVVRALVAQGSRVAVPWRQAAAFDELEQAVSSERLIGLEADLGHPDRARQFVDAAAAALGTLDGVALVAGGWAGGMSFERAPEDEWLRMLRTNLDTAAYVCRAALPRLVEGGGSVVAVGSQAAEAGGAGMAAYAVAKSALHALVRVLALENRARGVRFNAVLPGTIDTAANRSGMPAADRSDWTPPADLARTIVWLLSPDSAPVSGAFVPVVGRH